MPEGHYIEIYRGPDRRFFAKLYSDDGYGYLWRSPKYRWLWVARLDAAKQARIYISGRPGHNMQIIRPAATFIKRITL